MIWLLLALAQDVDVLIERLGDPDPVAREEAETALARMGSRPLDALRRAAESADPERRARAARLTLLAERERRQEELEARERPKQLRFLAAGAELGPGEAAVDGARFKVTRHPWPTGTIFESASERLLEGELEWIVVAATAGRALKLETCAIHSPRRVLVAERELKNPVLTIRGTRRWYCPTPVVFQDPREGDRWTGGGYTLKVDWPRIVLSSERPRAVEVLANALKQEDIQAELRPGVETHDRIGGGTGGGGRFGGRLGSRKADAAWCGCPGAPSTSAPPPAAVAVEHAVRASRFDCHPIADLARITLTFRKPVEEPFEVTTRPLD